MKINIDNDKKVALVILPLFAIAVSFFIYSNNNLKQTQMQLQRVYNAEIDSCQIISTVRIPYKGGKSDYTLFKVEGHGWHYPVILDKSANISDYNLFKEGVLIVKKKNTTDIKIIDGFTISQIKMRNPEEENDGKEMFKFPLIFFGFFTIVILFIPNSVFEDRRKNDPDSQPY